MKQLNLTLETNVEELGLFLAVVLSIRRTFSESLKKPQSDFSHMIVSSTENIRKLSLMSDPN